MEEQTAKCIYCGESDSMKSLFVLDQDDISVCPVFVYCCKCHYTCKAKLENIPEPCKKCGKYSEWEFIETERIDPVSKKCTYTKVELCCDGCKTLLSKTLGVTKPTTGEIALYIDKFLNWKRDWKNILPKDLDKLESLAKKKQDISDALGILIYYLPVDRGDYTARDKAIIDGRRERVSRLAVCAAENGIAVFPADTVLLRLARSDWETVKNIRMNVARALILYDVKRKKLENVHKLLKEPDGGKTFPPYLINVIILFLEKALGKEKVKEIHDRLEEIIYNESKKLIKKEGLDKSIVENAIKFFIKLSGKPDDSSVIPSLVRIARRGDRKEALTQSAVEALQEIYRKTKKLPLNIGKISCATCFSGRLYNAPKGMKLIKSWKGYGDNKEESYSCPKCGLHFLLTKSEHVSGTGDVDYSSYFYVFKRDPKTKKWITQKMYTLYEGHDFC